MTSPSKNRRLRTVAFAAVAALTLGAAMLPAAPAAARVFIGFGFPGVWGYYAPPPAYYYPPPAYYYPYAYYGYPWRPGYGYWHRHWWHHWHHHWHHHWWHHH